VNDDVDGYSSAMPLDRPRLRRLLLFWVTRVTGALLLLTVLYLMVAARPDGSDRPTLPLVAAGALAVALLVVAHLVQPRSAPVAVTPDLAGSDLPLD
jgi:hypothetical protein